MCTLALYFQEFQDYPLIVAANRDEYFTRPSGDPQVLIEKPLAFGGKDLLAGGTWLGVNEHGLLAGILNRRVDDEDHGAPRSRGLLCLDILNAKTPAEACAFLKQEQSASYRPFNLLFANAQEAYIAHNMKEKIELVRLRKGIHVISNTSIYDSASPKTNHAHTLFSDAAREVQQSLKQSFFKRWFGGGLPIWDQPAFIRLFKGILSNHASGNSKDPRGAICVHTSHYGTVSSTVIFCMHSQKRFFFHHAPASPCRGEYQSYLSVEIS